MLTKKAASSGLADFWRSRGLKAPCQARNRHARQQQYAAQKRADKEEVRGRFRRSKGKSIVCGCGVQTQRLTLFFSRKA